MAEKTTARMTELHFPYFVRRVRAIPGAMCFRTSSPVCTSANELMRGPRRAIAKHDYMSTATNSSGTNTCSLKHAFQLYSTAGISFYVWLQHFISM